MAWINNTGMSAKDARRWGNDGLSQMRKDNHYKEQENRSERASNEKRIKELEGQVAKQKAAPKPKPKPKPKAEKKEEPTGNPLAEMRESYDPYEYGEMLRKRQPGPQQIEPVKHSPEISAARQVANNYQAGINTSGSDQVNQMKQDGQDFADKYKLDLIKSGATK